MISPSPSGAGPRDRLPYLQPARRGSRRDGRAAEGARLESVCTQKVPWVRIPLSPPTSPSLQGSSRGTPWARQHSPLIRGVCASTRFESGPESALVGRLRRPMARFSLHSSQTVPFAIAPKARIASAPPTGESPPKERYGESLPKPGHGRLKHAVAHHRQRFLPSEDEWYKAAFYSATLVTYFDYPAAGSSGNRTRHTDSYAAYDCRQGSRRSAASPGAPKSARRRKAAARRGTSSPGNQTTI
jgi:hypothetical protein